MADKGTRRGEPPGLGGKGSLVAHAFPSPPGPSIIAYPVGLTEDQLPQLQAQAQAWVARLRRNRGRHTLEEEHWPHWREQTDKAITLRKQGYTWPRIHTRMKTPTRTLQTWVERRRKELG